ncbi:MAG TPA: DNA-directed RNA polymerase subunit alpha C-terminal domain-containing protein [Planctomycetia bacterium]|nr:DNA-directed RNA polymerase subunit alpha C-terminal domain-containing protein [Planctomycetia bacterium]
MADAPLINLAALLIERDEMNAGVVSQVRSALAEAPSQFKSLREVADKLEAQLAAGKGDASKIQLKLGIASFFLGRMDRAAELLKHGKTALALYYQGQSLIELRHYDESIKALDGSAKAGYAASEVQLHKAAAYRGMGSYDEALATLNSLDGYVKKTAEYLFQYGSILLAKGNPIGAVDYFEKAVQSDSRHAGALFQLAYHNDLQGNDDDAIGLYERALQVPPVRLGTLVNLGILYEDHGRYEKAAAIYGEILSAQPNHARARLFLSDAAASHDQHVEEEPGARTDRYNALLDMPVTDFELSVRSRNCLKRMNIRTLGDLTRCTEQQLLSSKNFGETSLLEIKQVMGMKGLRFGMTAEPAPKRTHPAFNPDEFGPAEQALFNTPLSELNLSVRARKCMTRLAIGTIGDLIQHNENELMECKNFGVTSLNEVRAKLKELNLKLRGD